MQGKILVVKKSTIISYIAYVTSRLWRQKCDVTNKYINSSNAVY